MVTFVYAHTFQQSQLDSKTSITKQARNFRESNLQIVNFTIVIFKPNTVVSAGLLCPLFLCTLLLRDNQFLYIQSLITLQIEIINLLHMLATACMHLRHRKLNYSAVQNTRSCAALHGQLGLHLPDMNCTHWHPAHHRVEANSCLNSIVQEILSKSF